MKVESIENAARFSNAWDSWEELKTWRKRIQGWGPYAEEDFIGIMNTTRQHTSGLHILLVHPSTHHAADDEVLRALRRGLGAEVHVASATDLPCALDGFDAAVVESAEDRAACTRLAELPTLIVDPNGCMGDCDSLVRLGIQEALPHRCVVCPHENVLASTIHWAVERKKLLQELEIARRRERHAALHDELTGLPNLRLYRERFDRMLRQALRTGKRFAVLMLDIDGFKKVNDEFGHEVGDQLLRDLAVRFEACVRETDTVARRGGDEFAILLDGIRRTKDAEIVAQKLLGSIARPTSLQETAIRPSVSIGAAVYPNDGTTYRALEGRADVNMYAVKHAGGNSFGYGASTRRTAGVRPNTHRRPKKRLRRR